MTDETLDAKANEIIKRIGLGKLVAGLAAVGMLTGVCAWKGVENSRGSRSAYAQTTTYQGQDDEGPNMSVAPDEPEDSYIPDMSFLPLFSEGEPRPWETYRDTQTKEKEAPQKQKRSQRKVTPYVQKPIPLNQNLGDCYQLDMENLGFKFSANHQAFKAGKFYAVKGRNVLTERLSPTKGFTPKKRDDCFFKGEVTLKNTIQKPLYNSDAQYEAAVPAGNVQ